MYVNDPFELTLEPKIEGWDQEEDENDEPDYDEIFHSEFRHYPGISGRSYHAAVDVCRFDEQGNHVVMAKNCVHFNEVDEEGPRVRPGWTIQMNRQSGSAAETGTGV